MYAIRKARKRASESGPARIDESDRFTKDLKASCAVACLESSDLESVKKSTGDKPDDHGRGV